MDSGSKHFGGKVEGNVLENQQLKGTFLPTGAQRVSNASPYLSLWQCSR